MISTLGAVGSFLLAVCAFPEVISSIRKGYCGTSLGLLLTWLSGEIFTLVYVCLTSKDEYLIANYLVNLAFIMVLLYYKTKPIKSEPAHVLDFTHLKD